MPHLRIINLVRFTPQLSKYSLLYAIRRHLSTRRAIAFAMHVIAP
jgi:hypothetical protein